MDYKFLITLIVGAVVTFAGIVSDFALQYAQYGNIYINRFLQYTVPEIITVVGCMIIIGAIIIQYKDRSL